MQILLDRLGLGAVDELQLLIMGLIFAAVYIILNIVADIAAIAANPRLRHPK